MRTSGMARRPYHSMFPCLCHAMTTSVALLDAAVRLCFAGMNEPQNTAQRCSPQHDSPGRRLAHQTPTGQPVPPTATGAVRRSQEMARSSASASRRSIGWFPKDARPTHRAVARDASSRPRPSSGRSHGRQHECPGASVRTVASAVLGCGSEQERERRQDPRGPRDLSNANAGTASGTLRRLRSSSAAQHAR